MDNDEPITAEEARRIALENKVKAKPSPTLDYFFECVRKEIAEDNAKLSMIFSFRVEGYEDFDEIQLNYLKSLGYTMEWDGATLWYTVSW